MATKITKIQIRRDSADNWTAANPTLSTGEIGFEYDTYKFKIGYNNLDWQQLPYFSGEGVIPPTLNEVLSAGNTALGYDAYVDGMRIHALTDANGKVVNGGLIGDLLPGNKFVEYDKDVHIKTLEFNSNNLGDTQNRFGSIYLKGDNGAGRNAIVFGAPGPDGLDTPGTGSLTYVPQPTEGAIGVIDEVDELGRVTALRIARNDTIGDNSLMGGKGYYNLDGIATQYTATYDPDNGGLGQGTGLRVNVINTDSEGAIPRNGITIQDAGTNYKVGEKFNVLVPGRLVLDAETAKSLPGEGEKTTVVTQEDLQNITTQSLKVSSEQRVVLEDTARQRQLPPTNGIENAEDYDFWTYRSLAQLEYMKPSMRDVVNQLPYADTPSDPSNSGFLEQSNPLCVINTAVGGFARDEWGKYVGGEMMRGGEIIVWYDGLPTDPANPSGPKGAWNFAKAAVEEDPIFNASEAAHFSYDPNPLGKSDIDSRDGVLMYAKEDNIANSDDRIDTTVMFMHNWTSVPTL